MRDTLPLLNQLNFPSLRRSALETLQVNLTYRCNQRCLHCHVNAGPSRTEALSEELIELLKTTKRQPIFGGKIEEAAAGPVKRMPGSRASRD